jgi:hypothetical protein
MPVITQRFESRQYTGTNGTDLITWLSGTVDLISDDGTTLVIVYSGSQRRIPVGSWIIATGGGADGVRSFHTDQTPADYATGWLELPA